MLKVIQSPAKYVQGPSALVQLGQYVKAYGQKALVIADDFVWELTGDTVQSSLALADVVMHYAVFAGECSQAEIDRLGLIFQDCAADVVIGVGGGKTLDTAKAVAHFGGVPIVIAPTIASTDAPTSALTVIYTEEGEFERYLLYPQNPNVVLMDTCIIAQAPTRLLVAGMGDALATYFEARACSHAYRNTMAGGLSTKAAMALAGLCYEVLLNDGYKAKVASENKVSTQALENIVEANTLLSGLGFESAGLAAAHAVHNGLTSIDECHHMYHGEKVAFGVLVQLVLENSPSEELAEVLEFCTQLGLPVTLAQLGLSDDAASYHEKIMGAAQLSCAEGETIHNMPFVVDADAVYAAILTADQFGREWLL